MISFLRYSLELVGRKSPALAQLRGQPGVTIRNVSSFTTVARRRTEEAHVLLCFLLAGNAWKRLRSDEL